jgi:hypothetical protein
MKEWIENESIKIIREFGFEESDECMNLIKMILTDFAEEVESNWNHNEYWPIDISDIIRNYVNQDGQRQ